MSDTALSPDDPLRQALDRTPARVLVGRAGTGYRTATWLKLREDHAAARDAVEEELDLPRAFRPEQIAAHGLFAVTTLARSKGEHLMRPDLGRRFDAASRERIQASCPAGCQFQVAIGDGLSALAAAAHAPALLDELSARAGERDWSFGRPFAVRHCRVGVVNDIGELLQPRVVVLLIGERPGLATAESLSAYLAFQPRCGQTDADRNLISNIHANGVRVPAAAARIIDLAALFVALGRSGVTVKEQPAAPQSLRDGPE
ncbi:ethanolamine ammonia-lyase subunit EutC [Limnoglobus roseus]|uniref:Ethanolamine ammonia-lyase small subunit n=1 Tax=Limnoglobus roseus TaxID=2598579 RepID=A0A5C1A9B9_9BACT|nr:ethanolamine ammonia-lyase subunit EutC [Limnoglobus roseus]QEL15320.1 ethanolamine ammonia-lyase subunit EutC [Limnoglobus roseus]